MEKTNYEKNHSTYFESPLISMIINRDPRRIERDGYFSHNSIHKNLNLHEHLHISKNCFKKEIFLRNKRERFSNLNIHIIIKK